MKQRQVTVNPERYEVEKIYLDTEGMRPIGTERTSGIDMAKIEVERQIRERSENAEMSEG